MSFKPFGVVKKVVTWTFAGMTDRFTMRLTGKKSSIAKHVASKIDNCEPWTDHFDEGSLKSIDESIKLKDYTATRFFLAFGSKENADPHCLDLAKLAVELLAMGEEVTFELFQCLE